MESSSRGRRGLGRNKSSAPNPVDTHVGTRVRLRRTLLGMSQEKLGEAIGLTFQQVQKYERGANRIGASRLYDLSQVLDVPVSFFFDDMPEGTLSSIDSATGLGLSEGSQSSFSHHADPMSQPDTAELARAFSSLDDVVVRRRIYDLARSLAVPFGAEEPASEDENG
jgi:transcriptional regulator with XRE-family HTH domain